MNNALNPSANKPTYPVGENVVCITVGDLISNGDFDAEATKYSGRVLIKKQPGNSNVYLYVISMTNGTLMVNGKGVESGNNKDITASDVEDYTSGTTWACGTDQSANNALWPTS